jgi:hypothetical protein
VLASTNKKAGLGSNRDRPSYCSHQFSRCKISRETFLESLRESFPGKLHRFLESFAGKLRSSGKASAFRGKASRESFDVPESY